MKAYTLVLLAMALLVVGIVGPDAQIIQPVTRLPFLNLAGATFIENDAANAQAGNNALALRNGTTRQQWNIYRTYTDDDNSEYLLVGWAGAVAFLSAEAEGTGTKRGFILQGGTGNGVELRTGGIQIGLYDTSPAALRPNTADQTSLGTPTLTWKHLHLSQMAEFTEMTAPAAGSANTARLFAQDNGAGKTQLCVQFDAGAAQCFATQP